MFVRGRRCAIESPSTKSWISVCWRSSRISTQTQAWKQDTEGRIWTAKHDLFRHSTSFSNGPMMQRSGSRVSQFSSEDLEPRSADSVIGSALPTVASLSIQLRGEEFGRASFVPAPCLCGTNVLRLCTQQIYPYIKAILGKVEIPKMKLSFLNILSSFKPYTSSLC